MGIRNTFLKFTGVSEKRTDYEVIAYIFMFVCILAGLYFRLKGLGRWPFTNDEYYIAASVESILNDGFPSFMCGGYYTRGLLYQYLMVPILSLGLEEELSFRIVPVISYLCALPALYKLGCKSSGRLVASLLVVVFSLSTVEVEISRFARMYMPFQAIFIWYMLFMYEATVEKNYQAKVWMYTLSLLSMFLWEGAIFLAILNFFPSIYHFKKSEVLNISICAITFFAVYSFLSFDFRHFPEGIISYWPADVNIDAAVRKSLFAPIMLYSELLNRKIWIVTLAILSLGSIGVGYKVLTRFEWDFRSRLGLLVLIIQSMASLFGLLALSLIMLVQFHWINKQILYTRTFVLVAVIVASNFCFWLILLTFTNMGELSLSAYNQDFLLNTILEKTAHLSDWIRKVISVIILMVYYPIGVFRFLYAWGSVYPLFVFLSLVLYLAGIGFATVTKDPSARGFSILSGLFIMLMIGVGILNIGGATRYTFFLWPLFILLSFSAAKLCIGNFVSSTRASAYTYIFLIVAVMAVSEDVDFYHLIKIDSADVNFRKIYRKEPKKTAHYILRRDYRGVANVVNNEIKTSDIVISSLQTVGHYTDKINYVYFESGQKEFASYTACKGTKSRWTNSNLIYNDFQLYSLIDNFDANVWFILNGGTPRKDEAKVLEKYGEHRYFTAEDELLTVLKIPPRKQAYSRL